MGISGAGLNAASIGTFVLTETSARSSRCARVSAKAIRAGRRFASSLLHDSFAAFKSLLNQCFNPRISNLHWLSGSLRGISATVLSASTSRPLAIRSSPVLTATTRCCSSEESCWRTWSLKTATSQGSSFCQAAGTRLSSCCWCFRPTAMASSLSHFSVAAFALLPSASGLETLRRVFLILCRWYFLP